MLRVGGRLQRCPRAACRLPKLCCASNGILSRSAFTVPSSENVANPGDYEGEKYKVPKETFRAPRNTPRKKTNEPGFGHYSVDAIVRVLSTSKKKALQDPAVPSVVEEDDEIPEREKHLLAQARDDDANPLEDYPISCEKLGFKFDTLPPDLHRAVKKVLKSFKASQFTMDGIRLSKYLYGRNIPWTEIVPDFVPTVFASKRRSAPKVVSKKILETYVESDLPWFEVPMVGKRMVPEHTAVTYGSREAVAYMASRLDSHYAVTFRVLNEIAKRMPDFEPRHVLDFGSGLGSATWAAHSIWGKSIKEYVCIDTSTTMTNMANLLLRQGDIKMSPSFKNVFYRNFLPVSTDVKYDVVIAGHSLSELSSEKDRWQAIETLWRKTEQYLVIVEHGFWPGFNIVREARRVILREKAFASGKNLRNGPAQPDAPQGFRIVDAEDEPLLTEWPEGYVFAPCPHDGPCPKERMIVNGTCHRPCNFSNNINGSIAEKNLNLFMAVHHKERLSYVVFKKGKRPETSSSEYDRLLRPMQRRGRHALALVCRPTGELEINTYTKAKNPGLYSGIRRARWGDMLAHMDVPAGRKILSQAPRKHKHSLAKDGKKAAAAAAFEGAEEQPLKPFESDDDPILARLDERSFDADSDDRIDGEYRPRSRRHRPADDPDFMSSHDVDDEFDE